MKSKAPLRVSFTNGPASPQGGGALVLGVWDNGVPHAAVHGHGLDRWVERVRAARPDFTGKIGNALVLRAPPLEGWDAVVLTGLGPFDDLVAERARLAGAEVGAALQTAGIARAVADLPLSADLAAAFAQGARLRTHALPDLRSKPLPDAPTPFETLEIRVADPSAAETAWAPLRAACEGVELARDLMHLPANVLTPQAFAEHAKALEALGVEVDIRNADTLARDGLALHFAVGKASTHPPCLAVLRWRGGGTDDAPTLLVGKGLTFDTGGLCIKPAAGMEEMKGDMGGAAAVIGTLHALAASKAPVSVTGLLGLAENMPGGDATRPGDVLTSHAGLTVEVVDTDAEGRLVLADALSWGIAAETPRAVVDLATLTGSVVTTLGKYHGGLFSRHDALATALRQAGDRSGEALWRLPLDPGVADDLKSDAADIKQCAPAGRLLPDALHAAWFLSRFVPEDVPWAHLDIAGVADCAEATALTPKGPTGFGVLLLLDWLAARDAG